MHSKQEKTELFCNILACPACKGDLQFAEDVFYCENCGENYPFINGKIYLEKNKLPEDEVDKLKFFLKKKLKNYYSLFTKIFSTVLPLRYEKDILSHLDINKDVVIEMGCGPKKINPAFIGVDIYGYEEVDIVCDLRKLPFKNESIDAFVSIAFLEHYNDVFNFSAKSFSILKSNGRHIHLTPFIYPFHASPKDYFRFTHQGLAELFKPCKCVSMYSLAGPVSAILTLLSEIFPLLFSFSNKKLHGVLHLLFSALLSPFKFLDYFFARKEKWLSSSAIIFSVFRKTAENQGTELE
jgi:uncharacterized protein YbaR (Trm112 family)